MSDVVQLTWPRADVESFMRAMEYNAKWLDKDADKAVASAAASLISTLRTSTRIAPKRRKVRQLSTGFVPGKQRQRSDLVRFAITGYWKAGGYQTKIIQAKTRENALKYAKINNRGLAKASWTWAAKKARISGGGSIGVKSKTDAIARRSVDVKRSTGVVEIHNRLPYIVDALRDGESGVESAMRRAANKLIGSADNLLKKRYGMF
jgi:hypothetical protein